jgi:hypothetical protein
MSTKKNPLIVLVLILALLFSVTAAYGVSTTPSSTNAAYGQSTSVVIHYYAFPGQITINPDGGGTIVPIAPTSSGGDFCLPGAGPFGAQSCESIGYVYVPLTTVNGRASEVLTIPRNVVETAFRRGYNTFTYRRYFTNAHENDPYATMTIRIVPGSIAAFSLKRIELYFNDGQRKNEIMVDRNFKGLKAHVDLYYNGSGLLNGYWEVDGLIIERVNRYVPPGTKITLTTPNIPDLPTFDPGYHIVKFIVTSPETSFEVPEIVYWVKGTEAPVLRALALLKPTDGSEVPPDSLFEWEKQDKVSVYMISFAKAEDNKVCFSALTRDATYQIPPAVLTDYLSAGQKYLWMVKGFDTENNVIAESSVQSFLLQEAAKP